MKLLLVCVELAVKQRDHSQVEINLNYYFKLFILAGLSIGGVSVGFAEQPYKCRSSNFWSCCCMKPEIRIYLNNNVIGKVVQPYYGPCWGPRNKICCPIMVLQVFNGADELIYSIT